MKFKVVSGSHREGKTVFRSGDIVETNRDLAKAFKNKFEKVLDEEKVVEKKPEAKAEEKKKPIGRTIQRGGANIHV